MNQVDKKIDNELKKKNNIEKVKKQSPSQKKKKIYDPYKMPAVLKFAEMHEKATRFAKLNKMDPKEFQKTMCPCCLLPTSNQPLSCCGNSLADIGKVSRTMKQYFQYLIFLMIIFVIMFFFASVPHFIANPDISNCILVGCTESYIGINNYFMKIVGNNTFMGDQLSIMCFVVVLLVFVAKYSFFFYLYKQYKRNDTKRKTAGDYTIHCHNFNDSSKKSEIIFELCDYFKDKKIIIDKGRQQIQLSEEHIFEISRIHNIHNLAELTTNYMKYIKKKKILNRKGNYDSDKMTKIEDSIRKLKGEIAKINKVEKKANFTGESFVTFNSLEIPGKLINNEWKVIWKKFFSNKPYFLKAHEPYDIIWSNFGISPWNRLGRIFISYILAFILIGVSFGAIIVVKNVQNNTEISSLSDDDEHILFKYGKIYGFLMLIIGIIVVINFVLRKILILVSLKEERKFFSVLESSKIFKVSWALFINTGIVILVTTTYILELDDYGPLLDPQGIIINVQMIMLISLSTPLIWSLMNPFHLLKWFKKRSMINELKKPQNHVLQLEANTAFERNNFELDFKYYSVFKTVCIAFFYQPVIPYGPLLAVIEILLWFLCDKYVLINRCSKPQELDFSFTIAMLSFFDIFFVLFPVGNLVFIRIFFKNDTAHPFLIAATVLVFMEAFIIRINVLFKCCKCCYNFEEKNENYFKVKYQFKSYRQENPLTSNLLRMGKKAIKSGTKIDVNAEENNDNEEGEIDLLNIIHLIGTQQGRVYGGGERVFVQDEAFVFNDLQNPNTIMGGGIYNDNPIGGNNFNGYEALMMNNAANAYMNYNQNFYENPADMYGYAPQNTQGNGLQYGNQQMNANYANNYFNNIYGQFQQIQDYAYQPDNAFTGYTQNPNSIPIGNNPAYNPTTTPYQNQGIPQNTTDQRYTGITGNTGIQGGNHYGAPPPPEPKPQVNPNYNHYGNNEADQINQQRNTGYTQNAFDFTNPTPGQNNQYADQNQYENTNNGNYFDQPNANNNAYGNRTSNPYNNRPSNPYGNNPDNAYGYGGGYGGGYQGGYNQ